MTAAEGQGPLRGEAFQKALRDAQNGQKRARRIRRATWTRANLRAPGAAYSPGMARRMPPPPAGDGGAER